MIPKPDKILTAPAHYYPQLDSIRGLSFLAVFFYHAYHPQFGSTGIGPFMQFIYHCLDYSIDVFFVLSSFLLTWLGLSEIEKNGNFSFKKYFLRRSLRIWPLYYVLMFASFIILPEVARHFNETPTLPPAYWYLFFISNYYTPGHVYFLRFLWTLSVEEQFYLALGLCFVFMKKRLDMMIALFMIVSIAFNIWNAVKNEDAYFNTLTYLFDFSAGSLAALMIKRNVGFIRKLAFISRGKAILFYCFLPAYLTVFFLLQNRMEEGTAKNIAFVLSKFVFIVFIAAFIAEQMLNKKPLLGLERNRFLIFTGKLSYGLYSFHGIVLTFAAILFTKLHINIPALPLAVVFLLITYGIASVSYYTFEKPFLRLKDRLRRV